MNPDPWLDRWLPLLRERSAGAPVVCQDLLAPFPAGPGSTGAVVASLSLHYFPWPATQALMDRIRATLRPGGLLLCRLNSTNDHHFGASGHPKLEDSYYLVSGASKRFFDAGSVARLFALGWRTLSTEEQVTGKYGSPKALWEVVLEKAGA